MIEPLDPVYAAVVDDLLDAFRSARISQRAFCEAIVCEANTYNAASLVDYLPEPERTTFEWWFTNEYGEQIEGGDDLRPRRAPGALAPPPSLGSAPTRWSWPANPERPIDVRNALHRAILARREPL